MFIRLQTEFTNRHSKSFNTENIKDMPVFGYSKDPLVNIPRDYLTT